MPTRAARRHDDRRSPAKPTRRVVSDALHGKRWVVLALCLICTFFTVMDLGIVVVALPSIGRALHSDPGAVQWILSGYALTFGIVPTIAGRLDDDFGQLPLLVVGIWGFLVLSVVAGLAPNALLLVANRPIQGAPGGSSNSGSWA